MLVTLLVIRAKSRCRCRCFCSTLFQPKTKLLFCNLSDLLILSVKFFRMEGFDDPGVFFSDNFGGEDHQSDVNTTFQGTKRKLKDFLRQFHEGNFNYKYR